VRFESGSSTASDIRGTLAQLCAGEIAGRRADEDIHDLQDGRHRSRDLAAAALVYTRG